MATARDIKVENYCTRVYTEFSGVKSRLLGFIHEIEAMKGPEKELLVTHIPHLRDVINAIDWKLEILTRACPFEWAGYKDVETVTSVQLQAEMPGQEISGGYLGG